MMIVDTHVHLYPGYDTGAMFCVFVRSACMLWHRMRPVACLTERGDCDAISCELLASRVIEGGGVLGVEALRMAAVWLCVLAVGFRLVCVARKADCDARAD
jgi:hypothetical protein